MKMQPQLFVQMVFTASEKPGNTLQISHVKTWPQGQAPSTLSLWVECSRFNKKLQTPTSRSGRKVWEVWGLLAVCAFPHSLQLDLPPPLTRPRSTEEVPAPTYPLLRAQRRAEGVEEAAPWWFVGAAVLAVLYHHHSPGQLCQLAPSIRAWKLSTWTGSKPDKNVVAGVLPDLWQHLRNTQGFWLLKAHRCRREVHIWAHYHCTNSITTQQRNFSLL